MKEGLPYPPDFPLGRKLGLLSRMYYGALLKRFEDVGIEKHFSILVILDSEKGKCSQQHISNLLGTDKATMVRMIDYLVEKDCVTREDDPSDRRAYNIRLTPKGKKMLPRIHKGMKTLNDNTLKGLSAKEKALFGRILDRMYRNLVREPSHTVTLKVDKIKKNN
jgi:MarR family transcriptional regulator, transcriptional regulator for hemolysin